MSSTKFPITERRVRKIVENVLQRLNNERENIIKDMKRDILTENLVGSDLERFYSRPRWLSSLRKDDSKTYASKELSGSDSEPLELYSLFRRGIKCEPALPRSRFWIPLEANFRTFHKTDIKFLDLPLNESSLQVLYEDNDDAFIDIPLHSLEVMEIVRGVGKECPSEQNTVNKVVDILHRFIKKNLQQCSVNRRELENLLRQEIDAGVAREAGGMPLLDTPLYYFCRTCWKFLCNQHSIPQEPWNSYDMGHHSRYFQANLKQKEPCGDLCFFSSLSSRRVSQEHYSRWTEEEKRLVDAAWSIIDKDCCLIAALSGLPCVSVWEYMIGENRPSRPSIDGNDESEENDDLYKPCSCRGRCDVRTCKCEPACEKGCLCSPRCPKKYKGCNCTDGCILDCNCYYSSTRLCDPDLCACKGQCSNRVRVKSSMKWLLIGKSDIHGFGCFAGQEIFQDEYIAEYTGELVNRFEHARRERVRLLEEPTRKLGNYFFKVTDETSVDSRSSGSKIRFANHSDTPNCRCQVHHLNAEGKIYVYASRNIHLGEELTFNYQEEFISEIVLGSRNE